MTNSRFAKHGLLVALLVACGTSHTPEPYVSPLGHAATHPEAKLVFLPARIAIESDDERFSGAGGDEGELAIRGALEQALALEHLDQRYVFASGPAADSAADDVGRWLGAVEVCAETSEPQAEAIPAVRECADDVGGTSVVFIDARLHVTSKKRKAGQIAAATFIGAAAVAIVAVAVIAAVRGRDTPSCDGPKARVATDMALEVTDAVARTALAGLEAGYIAPVCRNPLAPVGSDKHGFWTGNHLDLAVAVLSREGELLWYRSGKVPLDPSKPDEAATHLTGFMHGMP